MPSATAHSNVRCATGVARCRRSRVVRGAVAALATLASLGLAATSAHAQNCLLNGQSQCVVTGDATRSLFITISPNTRLIVPTGNIVLSTPATTELQTSVGVPVPVSVTVRSNTAWSVSISAGATVWSATPASARQNKPASDLQWGLSPTGSFVGLSTTPVTLQSGGATGAANIPLHLRTLYNFALDRAGSYQLQVRVTITAP